MMIAATMIRAGDRLLRTAAGLNLASVVAVPQR
jgi:hypothetical protein